MEKSLYQSIKDIVYMRDPDGGSVQAHRKIAMLQILFEQYEKQQRPARYVMLILDKLPDGTRRAFYWSRYGNGGAGTLCRNISDAFTFKNADSCRRAFDDDGGDSYLQQENGDILTYDKTRGDAGDYTYERYILEI